MKAMFRVLFLIALAIGGSMLWMLSHENEYIFFPAQPITQTPHDVAVPFRDVYFTTADGKRLHGWYMPQANARFTLLHMHGNAGNMSDRISRYRRWHDMGLSVFAFDYRGYGRSEGEPSEEGIYQDATAAWQWLQSEGLIASQVIIAGRSLGCAAATHLAAEVRPAGVAIETPFTNLPDMTANHYPWLPLHWFVKSRFDTEAAIGKIDAPLLLLSAADDEIIPHWMANSIFDAANEPKLHASLAGGHNDFESVSSQKYTIIWSKWLGELGHQQDEHPVLLIRNEQSASSLAFASLP